MQRRDAFRQRTRGLLFAVLVLSVSWSVLPAAASVGPDADAAPQLRRDPNWSLEEDLLGMALWFWPEGGRIYQTRGTELLAYDMETRSLVARQEAHVWDTASESYSSKGRHHIATVDRETGRVFTVYKRQGAPAVAGSVATGSAGRPVEDLQCPLTDGFLNPAPCVGGIGVFAGDDLAPLGEIPLELPNADSARLYVVPRALTYAPADADRGWDGRVLLIVEEIAHSALTEHGALPGLNTSTRYVTPRRNGAAITYAVAFNPESKRQEWAVRLEGCRNSRETRNWVAESDSHPTAVYRSARDGALYVGCHGNASQQGVVVKVPLDEEGRPSSLPVGVGDPMEQLSADEPSPEGLARPAARQEVFPGPEKVSAIMVDPGSGRILMRVIDAGEVWWVFDARAGQFIGTVGVGSYLLGHTTAGVDPGTGRLYVVAAKPRPHEAAAGSGGLYIADIRRNPLPQALVYAELGDAERDGAAWNSAGETALSLQPRTDSSPTKLYVTDGLGSREFRIIVDESPVSVDGEDAGEVVRTLDIDEAPGVTQATFDGTARGFGFRALLLGGVEAATRVGPADPVGLARGSWDLQGESTRVGGPAPQNVGPGPTGELVRQVAPRPSPCTDAQREVIAAFAGPRGPAVVDASSARGESQGLLVDTRTRDDLEGPVSRCGLETWEATFRTALMSQAPLEEPSAWPFGEDPGVASCTATDEDVAESWSDPVVGAFAASATCGQEEVSGWGQARGVGVEGVSVANTLSSFRIYRDPTRGMVARVESIARGVNIGGIVKIDTVRGVAESWANGRKAPAPETEEAAERPTNCDVARPAGTCFQRHVFGVSVRNPQGAQGYRCGPCGDESALVEGMNRALGAYASARFREPDPDLARGSNDGYLAAITKKGQERFSDIVLNADLLDTMVPMLEVIRYAPHGRPNSAQTPTYSFGTPPRGRQIFQFAAVEVSSTYGIQCLLVYDDATNTCAGEKLEPGAITVSLSDNDGKPLAGGAFEVRQDVDADGVLGLKDTLLPEGACVTADDGIGTCTLDNLQPGTYLVSQVAAPPGYAKSAEPFVVELASGEQRTVAFTNVSNVSTIDLQVTDENGQPLSGATFAAYPDSDSDGKVAPDAKPAAECTTDGQGVCQMKVPAGSYVLVQTAAPGGLEGIEPVPFTFASGGQVAAVTVVNYPPGAPAQPEAPASPVYTPPVDHAPPTEIVEDYSPVPDVPVIVEPPAVSVPERIGGTVTQVIRAPGDALRLLARDPKQAVAWTAALALFVVAAMAVRRRQQAMALIQG